MAVYQVWQYIRYGGILGMVVYGGKSGMVVYQVWQHQVWWYIRYGAIRFGGCILGI